MTDVRALFELVARNQQFNSEMQGSARQVQDFGRMASRAFRVVAVAAGGVTIGALARDITRTADEAYKMSQTLGIAVTELQALQYAGRMSGVENDKLRQSLVQLTKNLTEAGNSASHKGQIFEALGVSVRDAEGNMRSSTDVLRDVADRFAQMEDGVTKTTLAMRLFGEDSGSTLVPLLNQGRDGISALTDEAARMGLVMSEKSAKAAEGLRDELTRASSRFRGFATQVADETLPTVYNIAVAFNRASGDVSKADEQFQWLNQTLKVSAFTMFALKEHLGDLMGYMGAMAHLSDDRTFFERFKGMATSPALEVYRYISGKLDEEERSRMAELTAMREDRRREIEENIQRFVAMIEGIRSPIETGPARGGWDGAEGLADVLSRIGEESRDTAANMRALMAVQSEAKGIYERTRTPAEVLAAQMERYNALLDEGYINWDTYSRAVFQAQEAFESVGRTAEESRAGIAAIDKTARDLGWTFSSAFEDAIISGNKLRDVLQGLLQDVLRIAVRSSITAPLGDALTGVFSGMFGGARAAGGPVSGGTAYLVGERGPELFVPGASGGIVPNHAMGSGVTLNVINNVGAEVSTRESSDGRGGTNIDVLIDQAVSRKLAEHGSASNRAIRSTFGARSALAIR